MALTKQKKEEIFAAALEKVNTQKSAVFTDFTGLSVSKVSELKKTLKKEGVEYKVIKKNILAKVMDESNVEGVNVKDFEGSTGVAFSYDDEVAPAKIVYEFSKQEGIGSFKILGGILEGKAVSKDDVLALAKLPSKEQLLANLLAQMNAPVSGFVNVLAGNIKNLVYALNAIKDKKS